jgi:F-type H+-transporting ATPase subunit delta
MADASGSIARRYARALILIGQDGGDLGRIEDSLQTVQDVLNTGDNLLRRVLENPAFTGAERTRVMEAVLAGAGLHPMVFNFVRLLLDRSRFNRFDDIVVEYRLMADVLAGRIRAQVRTASPLSAAMAAEVKLSLTAATGKQVVVEYSIDPSLIGGLVAQVGDTVYDASVRARLDSLYLTLSGSSQAEA